MNPTSPLFRALFEHTPQAALLLEEENITACNPAALTLLASQEEQLVGRRLAQVLWKEDTQAASATRAWNQAWALCRQTGTATLSLSAHTLHLLRLEDASATLVTFQPSQSAEGKIKIQERERQLIAAGPLVIFRWQNAPGWPVEYASENVQTFLGHSAEDFTTGKIPYANVVHPDDLMQVAAEVQTYSDEGRVSFEQEYRMVRADGSVFWIYDITIVNRNAAGEITHYDGYLLDDTDRKAAQENQRQLAAIVENATDAMISASGQGNILHWNPAAQRLFGYSSEEVHGKPITILAPPELAEQAQQVLQVLKQGKSITGMETERLTKDGRRIPVMISASPILNAQAELQAFSVVITDIGERKKTEQKAREAQQRMALLIKNSPLAVIEWDLGFNVVSWNPSAEQIFGYPAQEAQGKHARLIIPPAVHPIVDDIWANLLRQTGGTRSTNDNVTKDGRTITCEWYNVPLTNAAGEVLGVTSLVQDVTEARLAEEKLRQIALQYQNLYTSVSEGIANVSLDGKIISCNTAFERLTGYELAELQKMAFQELTPPRWTEMETKILQEQVLVRGYSDLYQKEYIRKDGTVFPVELSVYLEKDSQGNPTGFSGFIRDITERKQSEDAIRQSEATLTNAMRVARMATWEFDTEEQAFTFNQEYYDLLRIDVNQVGGYKIGAQEFAQKYVHPEDAAIVGTSVQAAMETDDPNLQMQNESRNMRGDGSVMWSYIWFRIQKDEQGKTRKLYGVTQDITSRKEAEEQTRQQQEKFRLVADFTYDWEYWLGTDDKFVYVSPSAGRITGYTAEEFVENPHLFEEIIIPEDKNAFAGHVHDYHAEHSESAGEVEVRIRTKDGKERWISHLCQPLYDNNGLWLGRRGSNRDITTRKQAEQEAQRFQLMVRNSTDFINMSDMQGNMLFLNATGQRMVGMEESEVASAVIFNIISPASLATVQEQTLPALLERGAWSGQLTYRNQKTGQEVDVFASTYMLRHPLTNEPQYLVNISRDISQENALRRQLQETLQRRGYQVEISTQISQEIAAAPELSDLFERVVTLTKERLGYYHTQLLRYDSAQDAVVLINGYGETGEKMLAGKHRMKLGAGLIGLAAATGDTVLRPNLAADPDWQPKPLLPKTRGEVAVPIKLGERILGVLDVQSDQANALTEDDRLLLEGLCGQIAIAMEQTRLREEMNERLDEINRLNQAMRREGWQTFRQSAEIPTGFLYQQMSIAPVDPQEISSDAYAAIPIAVPGGEVIGSLAVTDDPQRPLTPEERSFLDEVSAQIALALDGARLFNQTQSALAETEELYEATAQLNTAKSFDEILESLRTNTILGRGSQNVSINTFSRPWTPEQEPDWIDVLARWSTLPTGTVIDRYPLSAFPAARMVLRPDAPSIFEDLLTATNLDDNTRALYTQRFGAKSTIFIPLVVSGQWIGYVNGIYQQHTAFPEAEVRRLMAMSSQAAVIINNLRLLNETKRQAEREAMLNTISQKIQSATTVDAVLQIAARELGHALGAQRAIAQLSVKEK